MADSKKITKLQVVEMMLAEEVIVSNEIFKDFLENEKALLEKKKSNKKPTKNQEENEVFKTTILEILSNAEKPMTIGELIKSNEDFAEFSTSKMTSLVKALKDNGSVVRTVEKGKALFSIA